ncbi:hypothetical protein BDR26DRAFT_871105, partial [Obelidium mucronatum]
LVHSQRSPPLSLRVISRLLAIHCLLAVIFWIAAGGGGGGGCHWRIPGHVMVTPFSLLALILAVLCV